MARDFKVRLIWFSLVAGFLCVRAIHAWHSGIPAGLEGPWQLQKGGEELLLVEADRLVGLVDGTLRVDSVLRFEGDCLTIRHGGLVEYWRAEVHGESMTLSRPGQVRAFRRLNSVPDIIRLTPASLGKSNPLSAERVASIQAELAERLRHEQETNKNRSASTEEVDAVVASNSRYLLSLVQEVGWIDAKRFGIKASYAATILAKHGGDLRLLLAALPLIEKDFKNAGDDAQAFAIVFDSIQLALGRKQRFGTQIRGAATEHPFVLPLEDATRVDELRKEIGLPPLADYLSVASKALQKEIAMPPVEDVAAGCVPVLASP